MCTGGRSKLECISRLSGTVPAGADGWDDGMTGSVMLLDMWWTATHCEPGRTSAGCVSAPPSLSLLSHPWRWCAAFGRAWWGAGVSGDDVNGGLVSIGDDASSLDQAIEKGMVGLDVDVVRLPPRPHSCLYPRWRPFRFRAPVEACVRCTYPIEWSRLIYWVYVSPVRPSSRTLVLPFGFL